MSSSKEDTPKDTESGKDHTDTVSENLTLNEETSEKDPPTDEIMVTASRDDSVPPVDWDESILHLEEDFQKLVEHLESLEKDQEINQIRYHGEQQRKLSLVSNRGTSYQQILLTMN